MRMRRAFQDREGDDVCDAFREHMVYRSALSLACGIVMRVAGETSRCLARHQQLGKLRLSLMEFNVIGCNLGKNLPGFFQALMLMHEADHKFIVPRFRNEASLQSWITEIIEEFRFFMLLDSFCVP